MTAALKTVQVGQDHTPGASKLSASRAVSCLPADLADFLHSHRPHSALTADATAPAWNGYLLTLACPCAVVFGDGSRHKTPSLICSVSPLSTEAEDASPARRRTVDTSPHAFTRRLSRSLLLRRFAGCCFAGCCRGHWLILPQGQSGQHLVAILLLSVHCDHHRALLERSGPDR